MENDNIVEVRFRSEEAPFFNLLKKHCTDNHVAESDYIKELIKRDLGWGQFMKPRKRDH